MNPLATELGPQAVESVPLAVPLAAREQSVPASTRGAMPIDISTASASMAHRKPEGLPLAAHPPPPDPFANSDTATTWRMEAFHTKL